MNATAQPLTRVAILEDDKPTRTYLATVIGGAPGFTCVGSYGTADQALEGLPAQDPDILLLDLGLPRRNGLEIIAELTHLLPRMTIVVLTIQDAPEVIFAALEAGAGGYLVKPVGPVEIAEALDEVLQGGAPMSAPIARLVIRSFRERNQRHQEPAQLSPREKEVLRLLAEGLARKEIAEQLDISLRTVASQLRTIYDKLHAHSGPEAVAKYLAPQRASGPS